jgi:thiol-disulfide isomerase/thioredoxin
VFHLNVVALIVTSFLLARADHRPVDLKLRSLTGEKVSLKSYLGHPVVVNFWATWCGPCQEEMPTLVEAEKEWAEQGVRFIAVSLDDEQSVANVSPFLNRFHVTFPVWTGANAGTLDRLRLGKGVPDTMFLDEHGLVYARVLGEIQQSQLDERLQWLLGGRKGSVVALVDNMQKASNR